MIAAQIAEAVVQAARGLDTPAYFNIAPQQASGTYYVFAFRSDSPIGGFDGAARRSAETIEIYAYSNLSADGVGPGIHAVAALTALYWALGNEVASRGGLDTGATDSGYHFARVRLTIQPKGT